MHLGYESSRITELRQRCRWAVDELDAISSTDPATADAMAALARLRSVIADGFIPSTTVVGDMDPLGGGGLRSASLAGADWYGDWLTSRMDTGYRHMTDDELFAELERLEDDLPYDEEIQPDMSDPMWVRFEQLAIELSVRSEIDVAFGDRLADAAFDTFLVPIALRFTRFDPDIVLAMLSKVGEWPSSSIDLDSGYRALGASSIIGFLADFPDLTFELLTDRDVARRNGAGFLEELLLWPRLDPDAVSRFLDAAMSLPFERPELLPRAGAVLQQLVALSNGSSFPVGFGPVIGPTITKIVVQYLPFFVTSLNGRVGVHLKDFDLHDIGIELGSQEEIVDLFGALVRDPTSLDILLAVIPALAVLGSQPGGPLDIDLDDVANYLRTLGDAAENEQLEEALEAARDRDTTTFTIELIFGAIEAITSVTGPLTVIGVDMSLDVIENGAKLFAQWSITATDLGLDFVSNIAYLLMIYGVGVAVVRGHKHRGSDPDDEGSVPSDDVAAAQDALDQIERALSAGASVDEVRGLLGDLERLVATIDREAGRILIDPRIVPPSFDVGADVDSER